MGIFNHNKFRLYRDDSDSPIPSDKAIRSALGTNSSRNVSKKNGGATGNAEAGGTAKKSYVTRVFDKAWKQSEANAEYRKVKNALMVVIPAIIGVTGGYLGGKAINKAKEKKMQRQEDEGEW